MPIPLRFTRPLADPDEHKRIVRKVDNARGLVNRRDAMLVPGKPPPPPPPPPPPDRPHLATPTSPGTKKGKTNAKSYAGLAPADPAADLDTSQLGDPSDAEDVVLWDAFALALAAGPQVGTDADGKRILISAIVGQHFEVELAMTGGDNGSIDGSTSLSYAYAAKTKTGYTFPGSQQPQTRPFANGIVTPATTGTGYIDQDGSFVLKYADEVWSASPCTTGGG